MLSGETESFIYIKVQNTNSKGGERMQVVEVAGVVNGFVKLVEEFKSGEVELEDAIRYIDMHPELKELFIMWYLRNTADEIRSFSLREHIDGYGYFKPYCKKIDELITEFADWLSFELSRKA